MEQTSSAPTAREIFNQIVKLQSELQNIRDTTELIQTMRDTNQHNGQDSVELDTQVVAEKIHGMVEVFQSREATYQQLLDVYEAMYNDFSETALDEQE